MTRIIELLLKSLKVRASYSTRSWTALHFPLLAGTVFQWSTEKKLAGLLLGALALALYSVAQRIAKNYSR